MKSKKDASHPNGLRVTRILYFFLIILPYAFALFLIFTYTKYTLIVQFILAGVFAFGWYGTGVRLFNKFYFKPYDDSLKSLLMQSGQYVLALVIANAVVVLLIGSPQL